MSEEIRPAQIYRSRRVKPLSREDREENEERFRRKLAELNEAEERGAGSGRQQETSGDDAEERRRGAPAHMGRHLDVET